MNLTLYTIGHSNHSWEEFLEMLQENLITHVVDVRSIPKSRFVPWSNENTLSTHLAKEKIKYLRLKELGGRRHTRVDSINQAWENASFRGYADYMQTPEFFTGLKKLNQLLKEKPRVAVMCAEAVPWRCHRSLIADAEVIRGIEVQHIISRTALKPHELTSFAVVDKTKRPYRVYYPLKDLFS